MDKRDTPFPDKMMSAAGQAMTAARPLPEDDAPRIRQAFEWQALLLRYLPDPLGPTHSARRFAPRA
jgi:hypothetical protein